MRKLQGMLLELLAQMALRSITGSTMPIRMPCWLVVSSHLVRSICLTEEDPIQAGTYLYMVGLMGNARLSKKLIDLLSTYSDV